jgi:hypothetical protein
MGLDPDDALVVAHECDHAALVEHDLSSKRDQTSVGDAVPHSVTPTGAGWRLVKER